jgi:drug/metabolite transporter (DMT)-like permease
MAVSTRDGPTFVSLVRDLAEESAALVRGEAKLARTEVTEAVTGIARGGAMIATAGVLTLLGSLSLFVGIILLVGDQWLPRDLYWLGALIVMVLSGAVAAVLLRRGAKQLSPSTLAPDQTLETLREDKEWLKRRMTSGGTSS